MGGREGGRESRRFVDSQVGRQVGGYDDKDVDQKRVTTTTNSTHSSWALICKLVRSTPQKLGVCIRQGHKKKGKTSIKTGVYDKQPSYLLCINDIYIYACLHFPSSYLHTCQKMVLFNCSLQSASSVKGAITISPVVGIIKPLGFNHLSNQVGRQIGRQVHPTEGHEYATYPPAPSDKDYQGLIQRLIPSLASYLPFSGNDVSLQHSLMNQQETNRLRDDNIYSFRYFHLFHCIYHQMIVALA